MADGHQDIATLGLEVDGRGYMRQVGEAATANERLAGSAQKAARSTSALDATIQRVASDVELARRQYVTSQLSLGEYRAAIELARIEMDALGASGRKGAAFLLEFETSLLDGTVQAEKLALAQAGVSDQTKDVAVKMHGGAYGAHRLNQTLASTLRQVLGLHPAMGQLVNVVGTLALGSVVMVAVLAGLAAIATAWARVAREARSAKQEMEDARDILTRLADQQDAELLGGPVAVAMIAVGREVREAIAERDRLQRALESAQTSPLGPGEDRVSRDMQVLSLQLQIASAQDRIAEGQRLINAGNVELGRQNEQVVEDLREAEQLTKMIASNSRAWSEEIAKLNRNFSKVAGTMKHIEQDGERKATIARALADKNDPKQIALGQVDAAETTERAWVKAAGAIGRAWGGAVGQVASIVQAGFTGGTGAAVAAGAGFVAGLFGPSAHDQAVRDNTNALRSLKDELNQVTGAQKRARAQSVVDTVMGAGIRWSGRNANPLQAMRVLEDLGYTFAEFKDIASEFGITLDFSLETWQQLDEALGLSADNAERITRAERERAALSIREFQDSLSLSALSPLSPTAQLAEARRQFDLMQNLALGGDLSAAESLPGAAQALLAASRTVNASGLAYVAEYNRVQDALTAVREALGDRDTIGEQSLTTLQDILGVLQNGISGLWERTEENTEAVREEGEATRSSNRGLFSIFGSGGPL